MTLWYTVIIMVTSVTDNNSTTKTSIITADTPPAEMPSDVATLQSMVKQLLDQVNDKTRKNVDLQSQIDWLKRQLFGRKSEKLNPNQRLLFEDAFDTLNQALAEASPEKSQAPTSSRKKRNKTNTPKMNGRAPLPAHLPRVPEYMDPAPWLIKGLQCIGDDTTEILEYIPAGFFIREIIRRKYAQPDGSGIVMAPLPPLPIEKGRPGPGVLAHVITSKYCDHLPLYRLEQIFERQGLNIPRSTQCDWIRDIRSPAVARLLRISCAT